MEVKNNCIHYKGDVPCLPHKKHGVHCPNCPYFESFTKRILIIKLGAAGDVIRTTPILRKLRAEFPRAEISWLTESPVFISPRFVDNILEWNFENVIWLQSQKFNLLVNLDKDKGALGMANSIQADEKKGYLPDNFGKCQAADEDAIHKWQTGLWDDLCLQNRKSYPQEIFEMFGYEFAGEKYILDLPAGNVDFNLPQDLKIVGLNTGCGSRWLTRLWGEANWCKLSDNLAAKGYFPLLLGGPQEDEMNRRIAAQSAAFYPGTFTMENFLNLVNRCDLVVTSVTMTMHIAIAFEKKIVLFNNIFNKHEFELYGLGKILEPEDKDCLGCYKNSCEFECMSTISPQRVLSVIDELI